MEKALKKHAPIFVLPTFLAFVIGFIIPFAQGFYLSFCKFTTVGNATFVGISNYTAAIKDTSFTSSFKFTVLFAIVSILLINVLAFGLALLLTQKLKGTNIFRTIFFMPNLIGGIVLSYIWLMIFNSVLSNFSKTIVSTQWYAFWGMIIVVCWQQIGYMMIIYIAGIQNIPGELIEAAKIDGANSWQLLRYVTLPMLMPTITICTFLTLTNSFKLFDQNLALNNGQPYIFQSDGSIIHSTEMLALNIYNTFYSRAGIAWQGIGQAKAVIFCILVVAISMIQLKATRSKEVQQ